MQNEIIPHEYIEGRIYVIRGQKVITDRDLSTLYGIDVRTIKQAVRRNPERFPKDFLLELNKDELKSLILFSDPYASAKKGLRYLPFAFTEQGVAMLSSVLKSPRAVTINIQIMRAFVHMRHLAKSNDHLWRKIEAMEKEYDENFKKIFDALRGAITEEENREIGFKTKDVRGVD